MNTASSFVSILFDILRRRQAHFDECLVKFLSPPEHTVNIIFEEEDEFQELLAHFDSLLDML